MENNNEFTNDNVKTDNNEKPITSDNVKTSREISNDNLVSFNKTDNILTSDEAKKRGRNGGIKSGESRKARKTARDLLTNILVKSLTDEQIEEILGSASALLGDDKSAYNVMMVKALQGAMQGDVKSQVFIRDTVGDAPIQKQEVQGTITADDKALIDNVRKRLLG